MSDDRPESAVPIFFPPSGPDGGEWRFTAAEQELLGLKPGDRLGTGIVGQPVEPTPPQPSYAELLAEVDKLRAMLPDLRLWANRGQSIHHRDGDCTCDGNPSTTNGPEEDCPWHGREYSYWVERAAEVEKLRGALETIRRHALKVNNAEYAPILTVAMCDILAVIERAGIDS